MFPITRRNGKSAPIVSGLFPGWEKFNLRHDADLIYGSIPLDDVLEHRPELRSLEPDVVVPYLTKNMHWRVLKLDYEPAKLDSLEVVVYATPLSYPPGAIDPVLGEDLRYDCITCGRDGGSRRAPSH